MPSVPNSRVIASIGSALDLRGSTRTMPTSRRRDRRAPAACNRPAPGPSTSTYASNDRRRRASSLRADRARAPSRAPARPARVRRVAQLHRHRGDGPFDRRRRRSHGHTRAVCGDSQPHGRIGHADGHRLASTGAVAPATDTGSVIASVSRCSALSGPTTSTVGGSAVTVADHVTRRRARLRRRARPARSAWPTARTPSADVDGVDLHDLDAERHASPRSAVR